MDINSLSGTTNTSPGSGAVSAPVLPAAPEVASGPVISSAAVEQTVQNSAAPKAPPAAPTIEQVQQAVKDMNQSFSANNQGVQFAIDQSSKRVVVKVMDEKTHQVLRQIPSEELLELSQALDQKVGKLINQQA